MRHEPISGQPVTVSATHFVRNFSELCRSADRAPVYIENHGKPGWALISADLLNAMVQGSAEQPAHEAHLQLDALMDSIVVRVLLVDDDFRLVRANPAARRHLDISNEAIGRRLDEILPCEKSDYTLAAAQRTQNSGTTEIFEADSVRYPGRSQRITTTRVARNIAIIIEDLGDPSISRETEAQLGAFRATLSAIPDAGFGTINMRGTIDSADPSLALFSGAPLTQLAGTRLGTLFDMTTRIGVNDLVERAIDRGESGSAPARLLAHGGSPVESIVAVAPRRGRQGIGGASFVIFARSGVGNA